MITAYDFADPLIAGDRGFCFDVHPKESAAALRKLADRIESGEINLTAVSVQSTAELQEFTETKLTLTFDETRKG